MGQTGARNPVPVASLLSAAVPALGERLLEARIRREWRELAGREIARRCQPGELRNGTLELIVDNSPWLQELALREAELRERLTRRYGPGTVRSLRFSPGPPPAEVPTRPRGGTPRPEPPTGEETRMIEAAIALIQDRELQRSARRLLEKACVHARARTDRL